MYNPRNKFGKNQWPKRIPSSCVQCGQILPLGRRSLKFCGSACYHLYQDGRPRPLALKRLTKPCAWCAAPVTRPQSNFHSEKTFCNTQCMGEWQSHHIRGCKHPKWRNGSQPNGQQQRFGPGWRKARTLARSRSSGRCALCKKPANHVHHLIPIRCFSDRRKAHHQHNLMILCRQCHPKIEAMFNKTMPLFASINWPSPSRPSPHS